MHRSLLTILVLFSFILSGGLMGCFDDNPPKKAPEAKPAQFFAPPPDARAGALEILDQMNDAMGLYYSTHHTREEGKGKRCQFASTTGWEDQVSDFMPYVATTGTSCVQVRTRARGVESRATATLTARYRKDECKGDWVMLQRDLTGIKDPGEDTCRILEVSPLREIQSARLGNPAAKQ